MELTVLKSIAAASEKWMKQLFSQWEDKRSIHGLFEHQNAAETLLQTVPFEDALAHILSREQRKALMEDENFKKAYEMVYWHSFSREYNSDMEACTSEEHRYLLGFDENGIENENVHVFPHRYGQLWWFEIFVVAPVYANNLRPLAIRWKRGEFYTVQFVGSMNESYRLRQLMQRPCYYLCRLEMTRNCLRRIEKKLAGLKDLMASFSAFKSGRRFDLSCRFGEIIAGSDKIGLRSWRKLLQKCNVYGWTPQEKKVLREVCLDNILPAVYYSLNNLQRRFKKPGSVSESIGYNKRFLNSGEHEALVFDYNRGWYVRLYVESCYRFDFLLANEQYFMTVELVDSLKNVPELADLLEKNRDSVLYMEDLQLKYI